MMDLLGHHLDLGRTNAPCGTQTAGLTFGQNVTATEVLMVALGQQILTGMPASLQNRFGDRSWWSFSCEVLF